MNIPGQSEVRYRQIMATWTNFWTQNESDQNGKPVQLLEILWQYYVHRGPNDNLLLTKATGTDKSGRDMPNDSSFLCFWTVGGVVIPHGRKMKNWRFCSYGNFEDKKHSFHLPAGYPGVR